MTTADIDRVRAELVLIGESRLADMHRSLAAAWAYPVTRALTLPDALTLAQRALEQACADFAAGRRVRPQDYRGE